MKASKFTDAQKAFVIKLDTRNNHGVRAMTGLIAGMAARGAI